LAQHFILAVFTSHHVAATINYAPGNALASEAIDPSKDSEIAHVAVMQPHTGQSSAALHKGDQRLVPCSPAWA